MAISTGLATLRRTLAQRLNFWGGDLSNNGPGFLSATGTSNTAIDTLRPEPDDEWDEAWLVLNPGSSDQINAPTAWRRIASTAGWVQATGTFTIQGLWPTPYNSPGPGYATGTSTNVTSSTMTDSGASWTTNQWKGHTVTLGGTTAFVLSNTATVLTLTTAGWASGTTPSNGTYTVTMPYELFKVFRPENWLQALNWAIVRAYPKRHISVSFEVPGDSNTRIIRWGDIVNNLAITNPTVAPTVTEVADGKGFYIPGSYSFAYTFYNDLGETLISPTTTITIVGTNSRITFGNIINVPDQVFGAIFYTSQIPNSTQLGSIPIGSGTYLVQPPAGTVPGINLNGVITGLTFNQPFFGEATFPPIYNTTNVDVQELHHILKRINPGAYPEIWNDLGSDNYKPLGGKTIMLMYFPAPQYWLKFVCTAPSATMKTETDVTDEPVEMLYSGAEHYLWNLLVKTSTIVNVNWKDLAKEAKDKYEELKNDYALDTPRSILYRPVIQVEY